MLKLIHSPASVGHVLIAGSHRSAVEIFQAELSYWLRAQGWGQKVGVSESALESLSSQLEVAFIPGEYQSNGPRQFRFETAPDVAEVKSLLHRWLYSVE